MKKRRTIVAVAGCGVGSYSSYVDFIEGIVSQAELLDYNVAVFSLFDLSDHKSKFISGEQNIYNLINYDEIDGFVFFDSTFWVDELRMRQIEEFRKKSNGNVVFIDSRRSFEFPNVVSDDISGFEIGVNHLIEQHGLKKIYCLTGFKGNLIAENRMRSYKNAMKKHGLEVKDEYCFYGDFWEEAAIRLADDILSGKVEKPEAIVCGNDPMAKNLCNRLIAGGISVPQEIKIVGYDFSEMGYSNIPSITSCRRPDINLGARCVCKLHKKLTGEEVEPFINGKGTFFRGESCGCQKEPEFVKVYSEKKCSIDYYFDKYTNSGMLEKMMAADNFDSLIDTLASMMYILRGFKQYSLCLNDSWNEFSENDDAFISEGYSENAFAALSLRNDGTYDKNVKFKTADMFPPGMLEEDKPIACFFIPIHFENRCFGYEAIKYERNDISSDFCYKFWTGNLNASLEYVRVKERLGIMYNKVYANSLRDGMTGILNRKGCDRVAAEYFEKSVREHKKLLVGVADLDNLKVINDTYGHQSGDNALTVLAMSLQSCCGVNDSCARTGGDEFVIIGICEEDIDPEDYRREIYHYLEQYNSSAENKYSVETSLGFFCDYAEQYGSYDLCHKIADELMYKNKAERKKGRKA